MKTKTKLYHLTFWITLYLLWVIVFHSYRVSITKTLTVEFCYLLFITAEYYTISLFIIPKFFQKKRYAGFVFITLTSTAIVAWIRTLVAIQMNRYFFHPSFQLDHTALFLNSLLYILFWVMIITLGKMLLDKIKSQQMLDALAKEKTKNELDFLKAQINPHALFNSLNTIYGHIDKENQIARKILLQFSELLRYQLYDCASEKVLLTKEIEYIKNYIAFQQLRKDKNLKVTFDYGKFDAELTIAPLLLVVLIENAFKFVSHHTSHENQICISISIENNYLKIKVMNTVEPVLPTTPSHLKGIGIHNLKRRLELLYPSSYSFTIEQDGQYYQTYLNLYIS